MSAAVLRLQPVTLQFRRTPGPLLAQIEAALAPHGQPLRWAITAVEPGLGGSCPLLTLEAVVLA
ncbi:hypothetical protein KBY75_03030 [Cyanobium sp. T1G-Tous]|uniref:hypothetical protein n=1 Tax=unclassified Cyanobium TaxID=2627006 RepID=UPI0020CCA87A|nr:MULTISPECIES: hypothetical protein [unclassified Cyanobium]MCP9778646.1 hypothetical protein [Cyanobium sp. Tous-M-B4]MCP9802537.1 hypothetical protein [Cyanobium sp. T1G-Tous]MCP9876516.1 hypothetical protein [Cyanobium sp. A2C-AMD]